MLKKAIITILVVGLAGVLAVIYWLPSIVNKEVITSELTTSFKKLTGLDLEIQGEVKIERFPTPHVTMNSMYVRNARGAATPFLLSVRLAEIWPSYRSLVSKRVDIREVNLDGVTIELEKLKSGQMNWDDTNVRTSAPIEIADISKVAGGSETGLAGTLFHVSNSYLRYTDTTTNSSSEYKDVRLAFLNGGDNAESTLNLNFSYRDKPLAITGRIGSLTRALSVGEVPANLTIVSGTNNLIYTGNTGYKNKEFIINGNVTLATDDVVSWISVISGTIQKDDLGTSYKPLPLKAKSDILTENGKIVFPNLTLDGAVIKGGARVEVTPPYGVDVKGDIGFLDLESIFSSRLFALKEVTDPIKEAMSVKESSFIVARKSFFSSLHLSSEIKFGDIIYNQQHIKDSHIDCEMDEGEMTVSQATMHLSGDTHVFFTGLGKESMDGYAIEGQIDAAGDDFSEAIKVFKANGVGIPPEDFKRFRLKSNILVSHKELRLSEVKARIENMGILGGFIALFGDRIKLTAAMRIGGANIDHLVKLWGIEEWQKSLFDTTPGAKYESYFERWLKKLDYDAALNLTFEQFILADMPREKAEVKVETTAGRIEFNDLKTTVNGSQITGNFGINVRNALPVLNIKLSADTFDPDAFFTKDGKAPEKKDEPKAAQNGAPKWSRDVFDFHWMEMLNASFHFKVGDYKQGTVHAQALDITGGMENRTLNVEALTGYIQNAQVAAKFAVTAGKIPSMSVAANVTALDPVQLVPFVPLLQGMTGRYNLSLRLDMSGIDMYSWISSLEGTVGVGGDEVNVHGFNLSGVIRSVSYVRTVADILNVIRRAFPGGDTLFSNIEGQWSVAGGVFKTSNTKLSNSQADGVMTSQVDLLNWQMQTSINLALKILDPVHPPGMVITFNGNLNNPETSLDTRSLEQYVTNKTSERMLQEYGTGTQ